MTHVDSIRYLEQAGIHYKPAESPELWCYLESHFAGPHAIGSKFNHISASSMAELIAIGEDVLLSAMVAGHRQGGILAPVSKVIDLPYIVGTEAAMPLARADKGHLLQLIARPGTPKERFIHILPAPADEIPCTRRMTVTGGLYADGHTAGYYDLFPGDHVNGEGTLAWLATPGEIIALVHEMEAKADDIALVSRAACEGMIEKAKKAIA
jgi:hypothetical protein